MYRPICLFLYDVIIIIFYYLTTRSFNDTNNGMNKEMMIFILTGWWDVLDSLYSVSEAGLELLSAPDLYVRDGGSPNLHLNRAMP